MNADWFYSEGTERKGPVSEDELRHLVSDGELKPADLVWRDGMSDWVEARTVQALFPRVVERSRPEGEGEGEGEGESPPRRSFNADRPSRRGQRDDEFEEDERPSRKDRRREEIDDDDDRPRVRRQTDDYEDEYDDRPRRRKGQKPSQVQAVGVMMLCGGILGILVGLSQIGYIGVVGAFTGIGCVCCLWPGMYLELVWGILAIIRGVNMMNQDDQGPPKTLLILQIICIVNGDFVNCVLGIVGLVMLGDEQVQKGLKQRLWTVAELQGDSVESSSVIPCLEPCAVFLEFARKAARIEQEDKVTVSLGASELETLVAALESTPSTTAAALREADFGEAANPRRSWLLMRKLKALTVTKPDMAGH